MVAQLCLLLSLFSEASLITEAQIVPLNAFIRVKTTYTIAFEAINPIPASGSIGIKFPNNFSFSDSLLSCSIIGTANCICLISSNLLTVTSCFPLPSLLVELTVASVLNPLYAGTASFELYTYSSQGIIKDWKTSDILTTFYAHPLTSASIISSSQTASALSTWALSLSLTYELHLEDFITLSLPLGYCSSNTFCEPACNCNKGSLVIIMQENASGKIIIQIHQILNPNDTGGLKNIVITTGNINGIIEQGSELAVSVDKASSMKVDVTLEYTKVFVSSWYLFEFNCAGVINSGAGVEISLPHEIGIQSGLIVEGIFNMKSTVSFEMNGNSVNVVDGFIEDVKNNETVGIKLSRLNNPKIVKDTEFGSVIVSIRGNYICQGSFSVKPTVGDLKVSVSADNLMINQYTKYTLAVNSDNTYEDFSLQIQFPLGFSLDDAACNGCAISQSIQFTNIERFPAVLVISNVKNAGFTRPTLNFSFISYSDSNFIYKIEQNTSISLQLTPGVMDLTVTPSSLITGDTATYDFIIIISDPLPPTANISIYTSKNMYIIDKTIQLQNIVNINPQYQIIVKASSITITNAVLSSFTGTLKFQIPSIKNPGSLSTETLIVFSADFGYFIDYNQYEISMKYPHSLKSESLFLSSLMVGGISDYTFEVSPFNIPIDMIRVKFPFSIPSPQCSMACSSSDNIVEFVHNSFGTTVNLKILNVLNPGSTKPFVLIISTYFQGSLSDSSSLTSTLNVPGALTLEYSLSQPKISQISDLSLIITVANAIPLGGYIGLSSIPNGDSSYCYISSEIPCNYNSNIFTLYPQTPTPLSSSILIKITGLLNPNTSDQLSINVCSGIGTFKIDCGSITLSYTCDSPCTSCKGSSASCTSCMYPYYFYNKICSLACDPGYYGLNSQCFLCRSPCLTCISETQCISCLISHPFLLDAFCYSTCPKGYFPSTDYKCLMCNSNCNDCTSLLFCNDCKSGYNLAGACFEVCPNGYYSQGSGCKPCGKGCSSCKSSNWCEACYSSSLMYKNTCVDACPEGITVSFNGQCLDCDYNCGTCRDLADFCISCTRGNLYKNKCVNTCPGGYFASQNMCRACASNCSTCETAESYCTGCFSGSFLYSGACLSECPVNTIDINGTCKCPLYCDSCTSKACLSCNLGFVYFNGTCDTSCPSSTFNSSGICINCQSNCEQCQDLTYCTICDKDYYLYSQSCYLSCPNQTYAEGNMCIDCIQPCLVCSGGAKSCSVCEFPFLLFNGSCVKECPENYTLYLQQCLPESTECSSNCTLKMLHNSKCDWPCNVKACDFDNQACLAANYTNTYNIKALPVPISLTTVLGLSISIGSSLIFGSSILAVSSSIISLLEPFASLALMGTIGTANGFRGRLALDMTNNSIKVLFTLLFIFNLLQFISNISFIVLYCKIVLPRDQGLKKWYNKFPCTGRSILAMCGVFSYKFIRISSSNIFKLQSCNAVASSPKILYNILIYLHLFSLIFVNLPVLGVCVYVIRVFSPGSYSYMVAIDCGAVISISIVLGIAEICANLLNSYTKDENNVSAPTETTDIDHKSYIAELKLKHGNDSNNVTTDRYAL